MNLARIYGQRTLRGLPLMGLAAGVNTSVLLGLFFWHGVTRQTSVSMPSLVLCGWVGVATYLAFADVGTRCAPFEMSLPATSRRLWWHSLGAIVVGGTMIIGLTLALIAFQSGSRMGLDVAPGTWVLPLALLTGLCLATLLLQAPRPRLARIPVTPALVAWKILVLAGTPVLLALAASAGWWGFALLLALMAGTATWSYRSVPAAYSLEPLESGAAEEAAAPIGVGRPSRWLVSWTVVRCLSAGLKELLAVPFILLFGVALGGGLLLIPDGDLRDLQYFYLPMTTYMLFALMGPRLCSLHQIDGLPLARRPMAAALLVPYLLTVGAGYGIGAIMATIGDAGVEYVDFTRIEGEYHVTSPLRVYEVGWHAPPPIRSPWGESQAPEVLSPLRGSRLVAYSPYSAPPGSSARYVAWQIGRAAEAVYGVSIPAGTIEERYVVTDRNGRVAPRGGSIRLRADHPFMPRSGPMFPTLMALTVSPWLLLTGLLLRAYRAGIGEWVRQTIVWGSLAALLVFAVGSSIATVVGLFEPWAMRALIEIPVMRLGATTSGTVAVWVGAALLIAGAYRFAEVQFVRMEIPARPSRYTLIGMGGSCASEG